MFPAGFQFTQTNLQDFVDCPRRFQLLYVVGQSWPGVQAEPLVEVERHVERGAWFHRLVHRHQLGVDPALLEVSIDDPEVLKWWRAYCTSTLLHDLGGVRYPEFAVSVEFEGVRLLAVYDLLLRADDGRVLIVDWKTHRRVPSRQWFAGRVQTHLYPFVLARGFRRVFDELLGDRLISLVYWCVAQPEEWVWFDYGAVDFEREAEYFRGLVEQIRSMVSWPRTEDERHCRFCVFRSLCGRGVVAGFDEELSNFFDNISSDGLFLGLGDVFEVGF